MIDQARAIGRGGKIFSGWGILALVLVATLGILARPGDAAAAKKVTVVLDWIGNQPQHFPYWLAKTKGWYAENGLEVKIQGGRGSNLAVQLVVAGRAQFGNVSASALVQAAGKQDVRAKMVGVFYQKDVTALGYFASSGIRALRDIEGKTMGIVPGTLQFVLWPSLAKAAGVDRSKVKLIMTNFRMVLSQWGAGRYEVTGNFLIGTTSGERFEKQGKKVREFVLSDYLPLIGHGIVVTDDLLASDPKTVAGFVKATQKAWAYLAKQPKVAAREAADVIVKNVEKSPPPATMVKYALKVIPSRMFSPSTRGKPLGWSNPDDWQKMIDVLAANDKLKRKPKVSDVVTNRFVK